jgi:gliding motility-associated lipoprotein GldH
MRKIILLIIISFVISSCSDTAIYDQYKSVSNDGWHKDSIFNFKFSPTDTISRNNLFINLRNNNNYQFSNLFLIVDIDFPNNTSVKDTLEYEMTDARGKFLGTGLTDLKENKLEYKTNVIFPVAGEYTISIQQAMRKSGAVDGVEKLEGVIDVGLRIEKLETND